MPVHMHTSLSIQMLERRCLDLRATLVDRVLFKSKTALPPTPRKLELNLGRRRVSPRTAGLELWNKDENPMNSIGGEW